MRVVNTDNLNQLPRTGIIYSGPVEAAVQQHKQKHGEPEIVYQFKRGNYEFIMIEATSEVKP